MTTFDASPLASNLRWISRMTGWNLDGEAEIASQENRSLRISCRGMYERAGAHHSRWTRTVLKAGTSIIEQDAPYRSSSDARWEGGMCASNQDRTSGSTPESLAAVYPRKVFTHPVPEEVRVSPEQRKRRIDFHGLTRVGGSMHQMRIPRRETPPDPIDLVVEPLALRHPARRVEHGPPPRSVLSGLGDARPSGRPRTGNAWFPQSACDPLHR